MLHFAKIDHFNIFGYLNTLTHTVKCTSLYGQMSTSPYGLEHDFQFCTLRPYGVEKVNMTKQVLPDLN